MNVHQVKIAKMKEKIKFKTERITSLTRAISILNRVSDKKEIVDVDEWDLEEYDDLLGKDAPRNIDDVSAPPPGPREETNDDCVLMQDDEEVSTSHSTGDEEQLMDEDCVLVSKSAQPAQSKAIAVGDDDPALEVDREFSAEYGFYTDVS